MTPATPQAPALSEARSEILDQVRRWARHENVGDVGTTSSFANMEALLRREYHGRFVIELVQNARDAWYANGRPREQRCTVRVVLHGDPPVLTVCNEGTALGVGGLFKHLCQFGESSKRVGTGIGHKGIGFKSVLEVTPCPQILSRVPSQGEFELQVRFDRELTEPLINLESPRTWEDLVRECDPEGLRDKYARLPVLRFPHWIDEPAAEVQHEAVFENVAFNTLVRLPYDVRLGPTRDAWFETVRSAMSGLGDEILILLDAFERVVVEDVVAGTRSDLCISRTKLRDLDGGGTVHRVGLTRNGIPSTTWLLYERSVGGDLSLAGELAVGVQVQWRDGRWHPVLCRPEARCFHLFFPTRISSGLPFLLHAYFEVDAGRTQFAPDADDRNRRLLDELRRLVVDSVGDLVRDEAVDTGSLASVFGHSDSVGDDPLAVGFRDAVLAELDDVHWVNALGNGLAAPSELLVEDHDTLATLLPRAFPSEYLRARIGCRHPSPDVLADPSARRFLASRPRRALFGVGGALEDLLRPGEDVAPWPADPEVADRGFEALIRVLAHAASNHRAWFNSTANGLRGDPVARFLAVVDEAGGNRRFVPPSADERGKGTAIFARVRGDDVAGSELGVPECLGVAFVPPSVLTQELLAGPGALLGIRPFGTDGVLDALPEQAWDEQQSEQVARFTWRLLLREAASRYSIKAQLDARHAFVPGREFWCEPSRVSERDDRREVYRLKALASTPIPAADGSWRPATELCFGPAWAAGRTAGTGDRLADEARRLRQDAYADLASLSRGAHELVAPPEVLAKFLRLDGEDLRWLRDDELAKWRLPGDPDSVDGLPDDVREQVHHELLHLWLIRLGVWEVPAVEAVVGDLRPEATEFDPWESREDLRLERAPWQAWIRDRRKEWFAVTYNHASVRIASDYRLRWSPNGAADPLVMARALTRGAALYTRLLRARLFCHRCANHTHRHWSRDECAPPSSLAWQLTRSAWVPVTVDAQQASPRRPTDTWWMADPIDDPSRVATNPRRFLALVARGVGPDLLKRVGGHLLEDARPDEIQGLLESLRKQFEAATLPVDMEAASARQAFLGLHRMLYVRLARTADDGAARSALDKTGVLARIGASLGYRVRASVVHDDGAFSQYRRYFIGKVPFGPLRIGEEDVARTLGLPAFVVTCRMSPVERQEPQTHVVADFLDEERLAEVMSLLTHIALGGRPLDPDSVDFQRRSQRLRNLETFRVSDVVLTLGVALPGTADVVTAQIGEGADKDVYLEWEGGQGPRLFHDFQGDDWFETHVRRRMGEVVARLVENAAFQDTLTLFFQEEGDARQAFLAERGVTQQGLQQVREALDRAGLLFREKARAWWAAVLGACGASMAELRDDLAASALQRLDSIGWGDAERRQRLVAAGAGDDARRDVSPEGALATLEAAGVDLADLHQRLRDLGDPGLSIGQADRLLRRWRSEHGFKIVWLLVHVGHMAPTEARARLGAWTPPTPVRLRLSVTAAEVLDDVVADLRSAGLVVPPDVLAGDFIDDALAELAGVDRHLWDETWRQVIEPEESAKLLRRRALAWREALEVPVVVLLTELGDLPHRIRAERDAYQAAIPATVAAPSDLRAALHRLLEERGILSLGSSVLEAVPDGADADAIDPDVALNALELNPAHVAEVRAALKKRGREKLDSLRRSMDELVRAGVAPKPYAGTGTATTRSSQIKGASHKKQRVRVGKVPARDLGRIGAVGEAWALAAVVQPLEVLLKTNPDRFATALGELRVLLEREWEGDAVDRLLPYVERALDPVLEPDERIEALATFLHLSDVSDSFGCDLLGWLPPYENAEPKALALEVKSSTGRHFLASHHEWKTAERLDEDYAFLVALRDGRGVRGLELLPRPEALRAAEPPRLAREPDTWKVTYQE
jgi:hypothetical protein